MSNMTGNLREYDSVSVSSATPITLSHHNCIVDVTATGGAVTITVPAATTLPDGFRVTVSRNIASDSNVTLAGGVVATLISTDSAREIQSDGTNWIVLSLGNAGVQGWQGSQGAQGVVGVGSQGPQGDNPGSQGPQGNQGNQGDIGYQGTPGDMTGTQGNQGNQGNQGSQGMAGLAGESG
jgi:hypothetical protein